jgi:hypothetical protein
MPTQDIGAFWAEPGERIERHVVIAATGVAEAFAAFSAAGLVAPAADRHLVTEAKRYLAEAKA